MASNTQDQGFDWDELKADLGQAWGGLADAVAPIRGWVLLGAAVLIVALVIELWWFSRDAGYCYGRNLSKPGHCHRLVSAGGTCPYHSDFWKVENVLFIIAIGVVGMHLGGIY